MFNQLDTLRQTVVADLPTTQRAQLGQFMTPNHLARFMASLFTEPMQPTAKLLDAGAGLGSLTVAFWQRVQQGWGTFGQLETVAYEIEPILFNGLQSNLNSFRSATDESTFRTQLIPDTRQRDFVEDTVFQVFGGESPDIDYAILNPPYKKINSQSSHRLLLRAVGIETVNLYTAFVALALLRLKPGGQLVALIPRSFCNGPYYKPFRAFMLSRASIRQIHLFGSRTKAFKDDAVLQENVIIHLVKGAPQAAVNISVSTDDSFSDLRTTPFSFDQIVKPNDVEACIHIPTRPETTSLNLPTAFSHTLAELGITVSTGPVVDFRVEKDLFKSPTEGTVPLLYPAHFGQKHIDWPKPDFRKANAIAHTESTQKWLYPAGFYVLVKRFSSKEEKKRLVARVTNPSTLPGQHYGFENHLNVLHSRKNGLPETLALGLAVYLNSSLVDHYFRQFNGHTQVNATDLRVLTYPSRAALIGLGEWAKPLADFEQTHIDQQLTTLL